MEQASWPALLPEVSFLLNSVSNASTKLSPHLLTYGREPRTPKDLAHSDGQNTIETVEEYWRKLRETKEALSALARSNRGRSAGASKARYNVGKRDGSMFRAGDKVLLRKEVRGPLDCKYEGPYTLLRRVGEDAMISLPGADKWVHLNRCKPYERSQLVSPTWGRPMEDIRREEEGTKRTRRTLRENERIIRVRLNLDLEQKRIHKMMPYMVTWFSPNCVMPGGIVNPHNG